MRRRTAAVLMATAVALAGTLPAAAQGDGAVVVEGEVQRIAVDLRGGGGHELTLVVPDDGAPLRVAAPGLATVPTGARVAVRVADASPSDITDPAGGAVVLDWDVLVATAPADAGDALAAPITPGPRSVAVITTTLTGQTPDGVPPAVIAAQITDDVAPYFADSTDDALQLTVGSTLAAPVYSGWGAETCTEAQAVAMLDWATQQAGVHPTLDNGRHAVVYTPVVWACYEVLAYGQQGDGGSVWLNGASGWATVAHELGRTLGLGGSHTRMACFSAWGRLVADGRAADCDVLGFEADPYDVMGGWFTGEPGPLSGAHLAQIGLVPEGAATEVTGSTTLTLQAVAGGSGLRFATFETAGVTYHVEYRGAVGRDSTLDTRMGNPRANPSYSWWPVGPGVVVRRADEPGTPVDTYLLDAPISDGGMLANEPENVLAPGLTFYSADDRVLVTLVSATPSQAQVRFVIRETPHAQIVMSKHLAGTFTDDVIAVDANGEMFLWEGRGGGRLGAMRRLGGGWSDLRVFAPGDWNGEGRNDLVSTDPAGDLWLHPGNGSGAFYSRVKIGNGWNGFRIVPAGDMNGDGRADLMAIDPQGRLWLYPGAGLGKFGRRVQVGNGWTGFELYAAGDANRDGRNDILSIDSAGRLWYYAGRGGGYFAMRKQVGNGWTGFTFASGADLNGDRLGDLLGRDPAGTLFFYPGKLGGGFATRQQIGTDW